MKETVLFIAVYILITCLLLFLRNVIFRGTKSGEEPQQQVTGEIETQRVLRKVERHNRNSLRLVTTDLNRSGIQLRNYAGSAHEGKGQRQ